MPDLVAVRNIADKAEQIARAFYIGNYDNSRND